MSGNTAI